MIFKLEEETCMNLINSFPQLFNKLLQTYRLTGIIADPDVYRMLRDPSFSLLNNESSDLDPFGNNSNIKQSISESVLAGSVFDSNSIYKSVNMFNDGPNPTHQFGVLTHTEFSNSSLTGISKYVYQIMNPLCNNFVMKTVEALLINWANCNKNSVGLSGLDLLDFSMNHLRKFQSNHMKSSHILQGGLKEEDILRTDLHMKILELTLYNDILPERLLKGIDFSKQMKNIKELRGGFSSSRFSKKVFFWTSYAQEEIDLLSFLFAYIKYCCSPKNFYDKEKQKYSSTRMAVFSSTLLNILKTFDGPENTPVSYTHLTLPTILLV